MPSLIKNLVIPSLLWCDQDGRIDVSRVHQDLPCLHMGLAVLLGGRIIILQSLYARSCHEQESDILYVFYLLLVDVLHCGRCI